MESKPEEERHYWLPVPQPDGRRHAFRGARRWPGDSAAETVCGETVALAAPSEMDWIMIPTCGVCWSALISEADPERPSWQSSDRDVAIARESLSKAEQ